MSVEFRVTSEYSDLKEIAYGRNISPEWRAIFEIKPAVGRIVRLRGRLPGRADIPDILYDLADFAEIEISETELQDHLSRLAEVETTYYPLAENLGARAALSCGLYERIPDFIDSAKEQTARIVWSSWKPERGEDFIDLHKRILAGLRKMLVFGWNKSNQHLPFSYVESYRLREAKPFQEQEVVSPAVKPIYRLRRATNHLSLPSVVATVDKAPPIEKIASFALMGYYPDGRDLVGVSEQIGVKRETLSSALDRSIDRLIAAKNGVIPGRRIQTIVRELIHSGVIRYPSGKNVERTNPRLKLFDSNLPLSFVESGEREIFSLAIAKSGNTLFYSTDQIAQRVGKSKVYVCRVIRRLAFRCDRS